MQNDETALVRETLAGNKAAFDKLVKLFAPRVFAIIYRFFSEKQQAEDIAQDVFIKAYRALHTYGQERPFANWLSAITTRHCYRELKKRKARPETNASAISFDGSAIIDILCFDPGSSARNTPEQKLVIKELAEKVLEKLSAREKMVLVLIEVEGKSMKETAALMGITPINVKVSSFRARKKAKKILQRLIK